MLWVRPPAPTFIKIIIIINKTKYILPSEFFFFSFFFLTLQEVAESVKKDFGTIDILVHSLANGPEVCNFFNSLNYTTIWYLHNKRFHFQQVSKPLLETSRKGYLAALSASSYSYISLLKHFIPIMNPGMLSSPFFIACLFSFHELWKLLAGRACLVLNFDSWY